MPEFDLLLPPTVNIQPDPREVFTGCASGKTSDGCTFCEGRAFVNPPENPDERLPNARPPKHNAFLPDMPVKVCPIIVGTGPPVLPSLIEK